MDSVQLPHLNSQLFHCAIGDLRQHVEAESVDVILTDPPYPKEYLHVYADLRDFACHALRPGGHLLAMSGHAWLRDILNLMHCEDECIRYQWTISQRVRGRNNGNLGRRICRIAYKPMLWYVKPPSNVKVQMPDEFDSGGKDKRYHHWGQNVSEMKMYLHYVARNGGVVCDPFLGGGTTAIAAVERGCTFIGADIDASCIETTKERLLTQQLILPDMELEQPIREPEVEQLALDSF